MLKFGDFVKDSWGGVLRVIKLSDYPNTQIRCISPLGVVSDISSFLLVHLPDFVDFDGPVKKEVKFYTSGLYTEWDDGIKYIRREGDKYEYFPKGIRANLEWNRFDDQLVKRGDLIEITEAEALELLLPPKPTHVPYTYDTCPPLFKITKKHDGKKFVATLYSESCVVIGVTVSDFKTILKKYTLEDGSPCGTKKESNE